MRFQTVTLRWRFMIMLCEFARGGTVHSYAPARDALASSRPLQMTHLNRALSTPRVYFKNQPRLTASQSLFPPGETAVPVSARAAESRSSGRTNWCRRGREGRGGRSLKFGGSLWKPPNSLVGFSLESMFSFFLLLISFESFMYNSLKV